MPKLLDRLIARIKRLGRPLYRAWRWGTWPFQDRYAIEDHTLVTIYTAHPEHFAGYQPLQSLGAPRQRRVTISLIATARNERQTARQLMESLLQQTRLPDEIVFCDTGSQDNTAELLRELAATSPVPCRVVSAHGVNIARGRNLAIEQARGEIIAVTDFGCEPEPTWLKALVAPFEIDPETQVAVGLFRAVDSCGRPARWWEAGSAQVTVDPATVLPPGASVAFTRLAWQNAGGYPEWLTLTAEDRYFGMELKRTTHTWAFVPEAIINWRAPDSWGACFRTAYRYGVGMSEVGYGARWQRQQLLLAVGWVSGVGLLLVSALTGSVGLLLLAVLWLGVWISLIYQQWRPVASTPLRRLAFGVAVNLGWTLGSAVGVRHQPLVDARRKSTLKGIWFVLSYVPIDDTGGGARGSQIVLELLRRQFLVVYMHRFPLRETAGVTICHPNLITWRWPDFPLEAFLQQYGDLPLRVLVEVPWDEHLPVLKRLRVAGARVIYDLMDDWHTSLGEGWYNAAAEETIIANADALVATAPALQGYLEQRAGRPVTLLPNAVNPNLFDYRRPYPRPADLPAAEWTILYAGALWGDWFDWDLLVQIARHYPAASVVALGEYAGQCRESLPNLHFLGLKPQRALPAYLAHANVAIIPWHVNAITLATSPLKLYEYLAMHKPVVVPNLPALCGLPLVLCSADATEFIRNVERARTLKADEALLGEFIQQNSWPARVNQLLQLVEP